MTYLLVDNNLSPKISKSLSGTYLEAYHVSELGFSSESDLYIWDFVKARSGAILTKDADFLHLLNRHGPPPKVIWIRTGNATTRHIIELLKAKQSTIEHFLREVHLGLLEIY